MARHIALVEEREFSTQIMRALGYETTWARNAEEALIILAEKSGQFDCVFSDVVMPGMSGIELAQEIRKLSASTYAKASAAACGTTRKLAKSCSRSEIIQ